MKKIAILAVLLMASTACSMMTMNDDMNMSSMDASSDDIASLIKQATTENKKAADAGGLWRDANKILKKAKASLKKGDAKKAVKLAKQALAQGKLGQTQADAEKNAGPWLF